MLLFQYSNRRRLASRLLSFDPVARLWHGAEPTVTTFRRTGKFLGSLSLAVALLTIVAAVLTVATFYESRTSTQAVTMQVYRSWWFNVLLGVLGLNLALAAALRWPWKHHQIGFVVTHGGLILILGGCSAAFHFGTEGMIGLRVGEPPSNVVQLEDRALIAMTPEGGQTFKETLRVDRCGVHPKTMALPGGLRVTLDEFCPNVATETVVREGGAEWNPAVQVCWQSKTTEQDLHQWLSAESPQIVNVAFVVASDAAQLAQITNAPPAGAVKEVRLVVVLKKDRLDVPVVGNVDKYLAVPGTEITARIQNYWPDFRMNDKHEIVSASEEPNNPVALVLLKRGESAERWFVFGNPEMQPMLRERKGTPIEVQMQLLVPLGRSQLTLVARLGSAGLYFTAQTKDGLKSGPLAIGQTMETGWMDAQLTVERFLTNAVMAEQVVRLPEDAEQSQSALRVTVHGDGAPRGEWLLFGKPILLHSGGKPMHLAFAWDSMRLPFTVALEDFVVERDEGSQSIAGWTSKVRFTDAATGEEKRADVWMNHPAVFKSYKFSQASWNPQDLKYTVLQVKKDPLWVIVLTWGGSGLTILGIGLMFYGRRWV